MLFKSLSRISANLGSSSAYHTASTPNDTILRSASPARTKTFQLQTSGLRRKLGLDCLFLFLFVFLIFQAGKIPQQRGKTANWPRPKRVCHENGPAAALLVGHVQHQFDVSPRKPTRYLQTLPFSIDCRPTSSLFIKNKR
jgi:hypothetical protein